MNPYQKLPALARKDLLTTSRWNQLRANLYAVEQQYRSGHVEGAGGAGNVGEHRLDTVFRSAGTVGWTGSDYSLSSRGWNSDASLQTGYHPGTGEVVVTFDNAGTGRYAGTRGNVFPMVQAASASCNNKPCLAMARFISSTPRVVHVYTAVLTSALNAGNAWAMEDATSYLGLASAADDFLVGPYQTLGAAANPGQGLRSGAKTSMAPQFCQAVGGLRYAQVQAHKNGYHNTQEICRTWAHITWNGSTYSIAKQVTDTNVGYLLSVTRTSAGVLTLDMNAGESSRAQIFCMPDYARSNGGASGDTYIINVEDQGGSFPDNVPVYIYKRGRVHTSLASPPVYETEVWNRDDTDFYVWIHWPAE
jgi:hypothetical protein